MAEGRPSSLQEEDQGIQRRRRSPNLGIATLALDALGKAFGVGALGILTNRDNFRLSDASSGLPG